eukprot:3078766-Prorocentrum_lima.AAC.1
MIHASAKGSAPGNPVLTLRRVGAGDRSCRLARELVGSSSAGPLFYGWGSLLFIFCPVKRLS